MTASSNPPAGRPERLVETAPPDVPQVAMDSSEGGALAASSAHPPQAAPAPWWIPAEDTPAASGEAQKNRRKAFLRYGKPALAFAPTLAALIYFGLIAAPRFEAQAAFVVRTAAKPAMSLGSFGAVLQMTGLSRSQDDVYSVHTYLTSREAVQELARRLPLREMYSRPEADPVTKFPPIYSGSTDEDFYNYLSWMITLKVNAVTSITTLDVQAFRADDAQKIAEVLLELAEQKINGINQRLEADSVKFAERQVVDKQNALIQAQLAITEFRNREMIIDPNRSSLIVTEVIGRLSQSLADAESNIRDLESSAPGSPSISSVKSNAESLRQQIESERHKISDGGSGLADKLSQFEDLELKRGFAEKALTAARNGLEMAREEERRQQLYLERVVEPNLSDRPTMPARFRGLLTVFAANLMALLMLWLIASGVGEHAGEKSV